MDVSSFMPFGGTDVRYAELDDARVVVLPVYFEVTPSYMGGSRYGAYHLLRASAEMEPMDEELLLDWSDAGVHTAPALIPESNPEKGVAAIRAEAGRYMKMNKPLLSVGGDHAVTIGLVQAAADVYGSVGVLQIDAHLDLRDAYNGSRYNHACVMRRVADDMKLPFVQVGIRSVAPEEGVYMREKGIRPFFAHDIAESGSDAWMDAVVARLPETVYISIDLDGLDPSVVPGTGTPEPGGLTYRQVAGLIRKVGKNRRVIGADINELVKIDGSVVSEFTAARLAGKVIAYCWLDTDAGE